MQPSLFGGHSVANELSDKIKSASGRMLGGLTRLRNGSDVATLWKRQFHPLGSFTLDHL